MSCNAVAQDDGDGCDDVAVANRACDAKVANERLDKRWLSNRSSSWVV